MIFLFLSLTGMDSNGSPSCFILSSFLNSTNPLPSTFLCRMCLQDSSSLGAIWGFSNFSTFFLFLNWTSYSIQDHSELNQLGRLSGLEIEVMAQFFFFFKSVSIVTSSHKSKLYIFYFHVVFKFCIEGIFKVNRDTYTSY